MNLTALEDALDQHFGKIGTPQRDHFEKDVTKALHTYRIKEAIKRVRMGQPLPQEEQVKLSPLHL